MTDAAENGAICVAVFRPDADRLLRQIATIREQTLRSWTCIVGIDGADPIAERSVREAIGDDPRFVVRAYPDNVGFYRNFERLLADVPASAPWIALSDQDDVWYPDKLASLVPLLSDATLVAGSARIVDGEGAHLGIARRRYGGLASLMIDNQVTGSMTVLSAAVREASLPFPTPTDAAYHDHWLGVVAAAMGTIRLEPTILQDYVQHGGNVIGEEIGHGVRTRLARLRGVGGGFRSARLYLAEHRWGWRVAMARVAAERVPAMSPSARRDLAVFARGDFSLALLGTIAVSIVRRRAPLGRALALLIGATVAPR